MRIEARGLAKRFGGRLVLRELDFELPPGSRVGLVGPNGSGKSTLLRVLVGLLGFEGELRFDGRRVGVGLRPGAEGIAYVPQVAPQLAAPVGELVAAVASLRGVDPDAVAKPAGELGVNLGALARQPLRSLSGGMRQKLLLALAFAARPALLLLDEPTGSLDAKSRERFFPCFGRLEPGASLILCSHRLEEVRQLVDQVWCLEEGRLAFVGPAEDFLASATTSWLEARPSGETAVRWLAARGFRPGAAGAWVRRATPVERRALVAELSAGQGPGLADLSVRDLESLEIAEGD